MTEPDPHALPPELRVDRRAFERHMADFPLARWMRPRLHDVDRVPEGPVLLVGNHGPLGVDTPFLVHAIFRDTGRIVRPLADRLFFKWGALGRFMVRATASVEARPNAALALLRAGEWVLVYPGGARETMRSPDQRYTLSWEGRLGFVRVALEAAVPIVPVACVGNDDVFVQLMGRDEVAQTALGKLVGSALGPNYVPPVFFPSFRPIALHYFFGEAIDVTPPAGVEPDDAWLEQASQRVQRALEALLEEGREHRRQRL